MGWGRFWPLGLGVLLGVLDQVSKSWALAGLSESPTVFFHLVRSSRPLTGAEDLLALGALTAAGIFFTLFLVLTLKKGSPPMVKKCQPGLAFLAAGLWSNTADRCFRPGGSVDFLGPFWASAPVFNLADVWIVAGSVAVAGVFILKGAKT